MARTLTVLGLVTAMLVLSIGIAFAVTKKVRATSDNRWNPAHPYVEKGTRVKWINNTNRVHNVKARRDIGTNWNYFRRLDPGESARKVFRQVGDYYFKCTLHGNMLGGIHVRRNL